MPCHTWIWIQIGKHWAYKKENKEEKDPVFGNGGFSVWSLEVLYLNQKEI
jgi:hypothetical protein